MDHTCKLHSKCLKDDSLEKCKVLRNDRIKFKECFETILSLGVNKTNASLS